MPGPWSAQAPVRWLAPRSPVAAPETASPAPRSAGAFGGLIGNRIGAALDDEDKERAYAAQMDALERGQPGAPVSWRNPDSGRYGTVVPGPPYQQAGRNCRSYTHTVYIDGRPQTTRGTACRNPGRQLDGDRLASHHT